MADLAVELSNSSDPEALAEVLESKAYSLFRDYPDGSASIELLNHLKSSPRTALEVVFYLPKSALFCVAVLKLGFRNLGWCSFLVIYIFLGVAVCYGFEIWGGVVFG